MIIDNSKVQFSNLGIGEYFRRGDKVLMKVDHNAGWQLDGGKDVVGGEEEVARAWVEGFIEMKDFVEIRNCTTFVFGGQGYLKIRRFSAVRLADQEVCDFDGNERVVEKEATWSLLR